MWNSFNEYTKKGDYKAFAATSSNPGADASSVGYTWEASTVERAVKGALEGCEKGREQQMTTPSCRVIYLGNRRIDAYSRDELAKVQKEYQAKPTAFR